MNEEKMKAHLPTVANYLEKRRKARENRLPKHLRPPEVWPLWIQIALNVGLMVTLTNLIIDRDDYLSEAGPAMGLVICFLILVYTLISAVRLRRQHHGIRGERLAKVNLALMIMTFIFWAATLTLFIS